MFSFPLHHVIIGTLFLMGYLGIIFEYVIKVNKTAIALGVAVLLWSVHFLSSAQGIAENVEMLGHHLSGIAQIIFFLLGAMTLVELIDAHRGFQVVTNIIQTNSKRKMLWMVALTSFFLSAVLDNLTTTLLMVSLLRKLIAQKEERFILCCAVIIAANAGGAWTPIGDVTTTMLWINGQLSSLPVMKALFLPSFVSMLLPLAWFSWQLKGKYQRPPKSKTVHLPEPGARRVLWFGVGAMVGVPFFKAYTGLPPFMGILLALGILWLITDVMHHRYEQRAHLRVPYVLTRIDVSSILFFLGILLCVGALDAAGILKLLAEGIQARVQSLSVVAGLIGIVSAVVDNVPLVAALMRMYPLDVYPMDSSLWHMIAYTAGTGGSILIIGSSAGVAVMGMEQVDFFSYLRKAALPIFLGYLLGFAVYLI